MSNKLVLIALSLMMISCETDIVSPIKSNQEVFTVRCGQEIVLETISEDYIEISENSFDCIGLDSFELTVNYVKTKADIIQSGFQTLSSDDRILESAGMIKIDFPEGVRINPEDPIKYNLSAKYYNPEMELFSYDAQRNLWDAEQKKLDVLGSERIELGRKLFDDHLCSSCHDKKQKHDLTGPALGRVGHFRELDWLMRFTRNSQQEIESGDSLAICLWEAFKPNVMTEATELTDADIINIYSFIENESELQKIPIDSTKFEYRCDQSRGESGGSDTGLGHGLFTNYNDKQDVYYILELFNNDWYNVDCFAYFGNEIAAPTLTIKNVEGPITANLTFTNYNTSIRFFQEADSYILNGSWGKDKLQWPEDEEVYVIILETDREGSMTKGKIEKHIFNGERNEIEIELEDMSLEAFNDMLGRIEALK